MRSITVITLVLVLIFEFTGVAAKQYALRPRPKELLPRSTAVDPNIFAPTTEEQFYVLAKDPYMIAKTIHQARKPKFVNFERFEDYLLPQAGICTTLPRSNITILSFPLSPDHYESARTQWQGNGTLVFIGHDPSCFAAEEERSSYKALSFEFNDASHIIRVTGRPLQFGDKHFPAPNELVIGKAPEDIRLVPHKKHEKRGDCGFFDWGCSLVQKLEENIDSPNHHINLNGKEFQPRKQYWPPDNSIASTLLPTAFTIDCLECRTSGGIDQVFHVQFNVKEDDDKDDDSDNDGDKDSASKQTRSRRDECKENCDDKDDDHSAHDMVKDHIKRAWVSWNVTEEIAIRKQIEIYTSAAVDYWCNIMLFGEPMGDVTCGEAVTAGGLTYIPKAASRPQQDHIKANGGPQELKKDGAKGFGYQMFPIEVGINLWMDLGFNTKLNVTLPGFEAKIPKGSVMEKTLMGDDRKDGAGFDPQMNFLAPDLSIEVQDLHFSVAVGPRIGINIGLPSIFKDYGFGFGIRLDLLRFDNLVKEYENVTSKCEPPTTAPSTQKPISGPYNDGKTPMPNAMGFTMDFKSGVWAYFNIAGFFISSDWVGSTAGNSMGGLYWGVKNIVAKCLPCVDEYSGEFGKDKGICFKDRIDQIFDFEALLDGGWLRSELKDAVHMANESINGLDESAEVEERPSGDPLTVCVPHRKIERRDDGDGDGGGDDDDDKDGNDDDDDDNEYDGKPKEHAVCQEQSDDKPEDANKMMHALAGS